jgi:hypothetical protein
MELVHTTISGHRIAFPEPEGETQAFLKRVRVDAADPKVTENDLIATIYGNDNPLLAPGIVPGRGMVTRETLANPLYRVLIDLLDRKRMDEKGLAIEDIAARYTMPVSAAAAELEISTSAVLQAIAAGRLPSWLKDGKHFLPPAAVAAFKPERRGPARVGPRLADLGVSMENAAAGAARVARMGLPVSSLVKAAKVIAQRGVSIPGGGGKTQLHSLAIEQAAEALVIRTGGERGASLRVKSSKIAKAEKDGRCLRAEVPAAWARVGVIYGASEKQRFVVLEPSDEENFIGAGANHLFVKGRFRIAEKVNNHRAALAAWKSFKSQ